MSAAVLVRDDKAGVLPVLPDLEPGWYVRMVKEARRTQLAVSGENLRRIEKAVDGAIGAVASRVGESGEGSLAEQWNRNLLEDLDRILTALRQDYSNLLRVGLAEMGQTAAERTAQVEDALRVPVDRRLGSVFKVGEVLSDGNSISVSFGQVALDAVERTVARVFSDGWRLSDRLYDLDAAARLTVRETLVQGVAEGASARRVAKRLESVLADKGSATLRSRAMLIARTEINNSYREAHALSVLDVNGSLKPWCAGIGWRLSASHPRPDICDVYASDDSAGLGSGNYLPGSLPVGHPRCLCYTVDVLKDFPDERYVVKEPDSEWLAKRK